jgi:hypothetical protein
MYTEVRLALVVIAVAVGLVGGYVALQAVNANLAVLRGWQRTEGMLRGAAPGDALDAFEVEIGSEPNTRRVAARVEHEMGLSATGVVTVYLDPADPGRARIGGVLQMWLWPATAALLCGLACLGLAGTLTVGRGAAVGDGAPSGHWRFSPPRPAEAGEIVVHPPKSEGKAPLFWSLLGVIAFASGVFAPAGSPFQRLVPLLLGLMFILGTWGLALHNTTLRISAGEKGLRESSALGWREVRWEQIRSVERRETTSTRRRAFDISEKLPFPGNTARSIVFADGYGFALLRMSNEMQPRAAVGRLLELCEARTGLHEQFRHFNVPDF